VRGGGPGCDEALLADARAHGYDASVEARLSARLHELDAHGPAVIVCTCSTLSGPNGSTFGWMRRSCASIARSPSAPSRAAGGSPVAAALESTLAPTRALFEACAAAAGTGATVVDAPCVEAWPLFERGDLAARPGASGNL
jgi:hypothetical protein